MAPPTGNRTGLGSAVMRANIDRQNQEQRPFRLSGREGPVTVLNISDTVMAHLINAIHDGQILPAFRDEPATITLKRSAERLQQKGLFPSAQQITALLAQSMQLRTQGTELRVGPAESVRLAGQPPFDRSVFDIEQCLYQLRVFSALDGRSSVYGLGIVTHSASSNSEAQVFTSQPGIEPTQVVWLSRHLEWNAEADLVEKWTPFVHKDSNQADNLTTTEEDTITQGAEIDTSLDVAEQVVTATTKSGTHRHHESAADCQGLTGQEILHPSSNFTSGSLFGGRALYIACDVPNGKVLPLLNKKRKVEGLPELVDGKTWHHRLMAAKKHIFGEAGYAKASADLKNAQKSDEAKKSYRSMLMDPATYDKFPRDKCTVKEWKKKQTTLISSNAADTATDPVPSDGQVNASADQDETSSPLVEAGGSSKKRAQEASNSELDDDALTPTRGQKRSKIEEEGNVEPSTSWPNTMPDSAQDLPAGDLDEHWEGWNLEIDDGDFGFVDPEVLREWFPDLDWDA